MKSSLFISMQQAPKVEYRPCEKSGYHYGEVLNMICLEPACSENMLCCCACVEEQHKDHNTKPLRLVILEASKAVLSVVPSAFNMDAALELINSQLKQGIESFNKYKKDMNAKMEAIEDSLIKFFTYLIEQVKLKNMDPKAQLQKAFQVLHSSSSEAKVYINSVKVLSGLISAKKQEKSLSQAEILISLDVATQDVKRSLKTNFEEIALKLASYSTTISEMSKNFDIWKQTNFKFSQTFKHPDIKVVTDLIVKSTNSSGYKFAIMEPTLQVGSSIRDIAFKIKESSSNWVAVGMCHKSIVVSKNYGFNFSSIGHGAYMVSANGGCWNNIKADQNNGIKSFKFVKGDIVAMRVNFAEKTATFKRGNDKFTLNFSTVEGDQLYPCVLFYYLNDEIEFLPNHAF